MLILLSTTTPAWIIATRAFLAAGRLALTIAVAAARVYSLHLPWLWCSDHLGPIYGVYDVVLNRPHQLVVHFVRLTLEGDQRILLAKGP
jgi:hypothetical protein